MAVHFGVQLLGRIMLARTKHSPFSYFTEASRLDRCSLENSDLLHQFPSCCTFCFLSLIDGIIGVSGAGGAGWGICVGYSCLLCREHNWLCLILARTRKLSCLFLFLTPLNLKGRGVSSVGRKADHVSWSSLDDLSSVTKFKDFFGTDIFTTDNRLPYKSCTIHNVLKSSKL